MRVLFALFALVASVVFAQVEFIHSPCSHPAGGIVSMQPSIAFDLTSSGMDQIAHAVLAFLQRYSSIPGAILVPFINGTQVMPVGGNILYNLTDIRLKSINIADVSNSEDVAAQVTNLRYSGIDATIVAEYSFYQDNWFKLPRGKGIATIVAKQGTVDVGIANFPEGKLAVAQSSTKFESFDISVTTGMDLLINAFLALFKGPLTTVINKQVSTMFAKTLNDGFAAMDTLVPHSMTILKPPYATEISFGYATPQVAETSVRQYLEFEFTPKTDSATVVSSCNAPVMRAEVPSLKEIGGEGFDVVSAIPESTINTLFWTLFTNNYLNFVLPADKEIVISTMFPDHPVDMHVQAGFSPVVHFNHDDTSAASATLFLNITAIEPKNGNVFTTFTAANNVKFHVNLKASDFDPTKGYHNASLSIKMETVDVKVSNIKFFGIAVPDWTISALTSKLQVMIQRAVQEVVDFAAGDGIPLPFPGFIGIDSGKIEFADGVSYLKLKIAVLSE